LRVGARCGKERSHEESAILGPGDRARGARGPEPGDERRPGGAQPPARPGGGPPPLVGRSPFVTELVDAEARFARLEAAVEQFRIDIERWWNGALPLPPEESRRRIERELRDIRGGAAKGAVEQFRLGSLESRFNSLSELFGRRLREREEGRAPIPVRPVAEAPRLDAAAGIVVSARLEGDAVQALWAKLASSDAGSRLELETFRGYLSRQLEEIRARTGSDSVQFRVVEEEGRLKLKAKPLHAPAKGAT
jgi:hypothetical protein